MHAKQSQGSDIYNLKFTVSRNVRHIEPDLLSFNT